MATKETLDSELADIVERKSEQRATVKVQGAFPVPESRTRHEVAKMFVRFYFVILIGIMIGIPLYNYFAVKHLRVNELVIPLKDTILTYSAVVGPTIGLVVAYYFKSSSKD